MVKKGLSSTTIIDVNYCLERLEVCQRLETPEGQSSMGPSSLGTPGRKPDPGIPWWGWAGGGWLGSPGMSWLCKGELAGVTVTVPILTARICLGSQCSGGVPGHASPC